MTAQNEAIVEEAKLMTNAVKDRTLSNRQRTRKIREHRSDEKNKQKEIEGFELQKSDGELSLNEDNNLLEEPNIEISQPTVKTYQDRNLELLKKNKQEGKRGRGK